MRRYSFVCRVLCIAAIVAVMLLPGLTWAAAPMASYERVSSETFVGGMTPEEEAAQMAVLHAWLMKEMPAGVLSNPIRVGLSDQERNELKARQQEKGGPAVVGRTKLINETIRFSELDAALLSDAARTVGHGVLRSTPDGGFVWAAAVVADGAAALRVNIRGLHLPADADLFFFTEQGQAFGPYSRKGPNGNGEFWSDTVIGSQGVILLRHYGPDGAADLKKTSFVISDAGHIGQELIAGLRSGFMPEAFCSFNVPCIINASCPGASAVVNPLRNAVALLQWVSGQFIYTCTGSLLNDTVAASQTPYLLTANHCINKAADATNLQAYFQFSVACNGSCPAQTQPGGIQRLGATIKATGATGDFTLMQLNSAPPGGSVFLGWNNTPVANTNNTPLYRISHPAWAPQAYSAGAVSTTAPTCGGWPRGERIYSRTTTGGTEGGSSGSPVVNGSSEVVGQLSGACGTNVNNDCDQVNNATVDGAFAFYYPSVQPFLAPGGGCTPTTEVCTDGIDNDCDGLIDCADPNCSASPSCTPTCSPAGSACTTNSQCCSNRCKGGGGGKTCR